MWVECRKHELAVLLNSLVADSCHDYVGRNCIDYDYMCCTTLLWPIPVSATQVAICCT